jgi:alpha-beta hydrolase superfamily lysophospholipase
MEHYESNWQSFDGLKLYTQGWKPESEAKAVICLVHGLGEHSERYEHVAQYLTDNGYAVLSFDLRGHGKSGGARGHTPSVEAFRKDIDLLIQEAKQRYPQLPHFLYGHSLGGILVLNYALSRKPELAGVVATSPGLRTSLQEQTTKIAFANIAGAILPNLSMSTGLETEQISRSWEVVEIYKNDPLVHDKATLSMAKNTIQAIDWTFEHASEFNLPLLLVHGSEDNIAYARGSEEFAGHVKEDCTVKLWDGLYHETHNEPEKEQVLEFMLNWLNEHIPTD